LMVQSMLFSGTRSLPGNQLVHAGLPQRRSNSGGLIIGRPLTRGMSMPSSTSSCQEVRPQARTLYGVGIPALNAAE
jgi:hypothetical protein